MRCLAAIFIGALAVTALVTAESAPPPTTFEPVLHRFLTRADEPLITYRGTRHLEGRNDRFNVAGWMEISTELTAEGFHYRVLSEGGSEMVRHRVFLAMLENEEQVFASGDAVRSSFTASNYDLTPGTSTEPGLVKLFARPKRKDITLIDGAVYITDTDADLVRVEGQLAKNPSFWTRRVNVVKQYGRVGGLRVPLRVDSTAQLRFAGTSTMTMTYDYDMINGVSVAPALARARNVPVETASELH
jgi:hypothetical protein